MNFNKPDIKTKLSWVYTAKLAAADERAERWRDSEMYDGAQWTAEDEAEAIDAGITPLTINRTWPVINLIRGSQTINKTNIIAKARTNKDSEISSVMTEGIQFILDQNMGQYLISSAFSDAISPGFGYLKTGLSTDPRRERIQIVHGSWTELWWDPFSTPWFDPRTCKYVFTQKWTDLEALQAIFPEKSKEIEDSFSEFSSRPSPDYSPIDDEAQLIEDERKYLQSNDWADADRKRIRPVELWYTVFEPAVFAIHSNGQTFELTPNLGMQRLSEIVSYATELVKTVVRKMRVSTFIGELELEDVPTPFSHDQYPHVPFIGFLDRFGYPYGIPRQIREQDIEINKRRSMVLRLLTARRVIAEKGVAEDEDILFEEANKPDGFLLVNDMSKLKIEEQAQLAPIQQAVLQESEREIQEVSGANAERLGLKSNAISGVAIQERRAQGATITAPVFDNLNRSLKILGELTVNLIQSEWRTQKVLRITDRLTGAERFSVINEVFRGADGEIEIRNNITQGKYDIVISDAPMTDTTREQHALLIMEAIKKSPPEIIPRLLMLYFEFANLPNKDQLLLKLKPLMNVDPSEEEMTPEELKQKVLAQLESQRQIDASVSEMKMQDMQLDLAKKQLDNQLVSAKIEEVLAGIPAKALKAKMDVGKLGVSQSRAETERGRMEVEAFKTGAELVRKGVAA